MFACFNKSLQLLSKTIYRNNSGAQDSYTVLLSVVFTHGLRFLEQQAKNTTFIKLLVKWRLSVTDHEVSLTVNAVIGDDFHRVMKAFVP